MTISSTTNRNDYVGNGATTVYVYGFRILAATDLYVVKMDTANNLTVLVLGVDYTVTGVGATSGSITLTTALPNLYALTIRRIRPLTQTTDIRNQGTYFPEIHEDEFDHLVMIDQQLQEQLNRSMLLQETDTTTGPLSLPLTADRISKFLAFDASGNPIASAGGISPAVPVSAFMQTVLDDTTAAAARTTLGAQASGNYITALTGDVIATGPGSVASALAPTNVNLQTLSKPAGVSVHGTNTNDNAAAGYIGEYVESVVSAVSTPLTAIWGDMTSISLTAGDWDISLVAAINLNNSNTGATVIIGISPNSGNSGAGLAIGSNESLGFFATSTSNSFYISLAIPNYRISITATTTFYAKMQSGFSSGGPQYNGRLSARRVR